MECLDIANQKKQTSGAAATPAAASVPVNGTSVAEALRRMHRVSLDFARQRSVLRGPLAKESRVLLASYSDIVERTKQP